MQTSDQDRCATSDGALFYVLERLRMCTYIAGAPLACHQKRKQPIEWHHVSCGSTGSTEAGRRKKVRYHKIEWWVIYKEV